MHAVLIPGLLRCFDTNFISFLRSFPNDTMFFVVTEIQYANEAELLRQELNAEIVFIDDPEHHDVSVTLYQQNLTNDASQWLKLHIAIEHVLRYERSNRVHFSFLHKLRTDIKGVSSFSSLLDGQDGPSKEIVSNDYILISHDLIFSCSARLAQVLLGFLTYSTFFRYDKSFFERELFALNREVLESSNYTSAHAKAYPVGIITDNSSAEKWTEILHQRFKTRLEAACSFQATLEAKERTIAVDMAWENSPKVRTWGQKYRRDGMFPTWLRYLNRCGIRTRQYSIPIGLSSSRFAATPFTKALLGQFDAQNYGLLQDPIDWLGEFNAFRSCGGNIQKLAQVLAETCLSDRRNMQDVEFKALLSAVFLIIDYVPRVYISKLSRL